MEDEKIIKEWYKMTDFLAKNDVKYLECEDKIYRPDFRKFAKGDEKILEKMNNSYVTKFENYVKVQRRYWANEKRKKEQKRF